MASENVDATDRDFPRILSSSIIQYPLLLALVDLNRFGKVCLLCSPYFLLLRYILDNSQLGGKLSLDVEKAFKKLQEIALSNGELFVKSGRMVITGIDYIRLAEFSGDNVIASSLYSELRAKPGVGVHTKDCKLGRKYSDPVGGNRRPFVCWFDQLGNFRFTPGDETGTAIRKFGEMLGILELHKLITTVGGK